jgi:hypothetical protein
VTFVFFDGTFARMNTDLPRLAEALVALGCPREKSNEMAAQLDKRARQLAEGPHGNYEQALSHLLNLMKQGWAAKERGWS